MAESFNINKYRQGYSIGVGGVVLYEKKVLLVRSMGRSRGQWSIPGGFVEPDETMDVAVKREIAEEAQVHAELKGLIAARSRVMEKENSAYLVFLLTADSDEAQPDGVEVDQAQYFTLAEVEALPKVNELSRLIVTKVLADESKLLTFQAHPTVSPDEYVLYI